MKYLLITVLALTGCTPNNDKMEDVTAGTSVVCLNGVQYWRTNTTGNGIIGSSLAPKYSAHFKLPDTCL